jgi:hypothetical protein
LSARPASSIVHLYRQVTTEQLSVSLPPFAALPETLTTTIRDFIIGVAARPAVSSLTSTRRIVMINLGKVSVETTSPKFGGKESANSSQPLG